MGKAPDAFRTISEVAAFLDTPAHVLRFWESKFPQVRPVKRAGGRRYYRPDDIALLGGIKILLHEQGMTIRGVQKLLRERGPRYVAGLSSLPWEGEGVEEPAPAEDPVIVGPWPGAREELTARPSVLEAFVAGTVARMEAEEEPEAGEPPVESEPESAPESAPEAGPEPERESRVERLRAALSRADLPRLRESAPRLAPLVARLRELRAGRG
ncbi:MerR family transcriptional regulator [Rubellimicrobium aerolatum]|uniref:MerR family transcriptional regulator n=1 Tax=Rubellimicrobium aerolatum TaxID=490979 RepID=A0ABW0S618_9RHOB|nr:DNA-binding transcriptional MerR regulator [Rubellimicrobium aerolatum]